MEWQKAPSGVREKVEACELWSYGEWVHYQISHSDSDEKPFGGLEVYSERDVRMPKKDRSLGMADASKVVHVIVIAVRKVKVLFEGCLCGDQQALANKVPFPVLERCVVPAKVSFFSHALLRRKQLVDQGRVMFYINWSSLETEPLRCPLHVFGGTAWQGTWNGRIQSACAAYPSSVSVVEFKGRGSVKSIEDVQVFAPLTRPEQ
ncbi:hypothetical protein BU15DRAFT_68159 [Melanogaster broomeanus]|nr:hypothetical protein BU15DRAFT_68159 [Melanogaster broomeanus]